jgi:hypothetical protein
MTVLPDCEYDFSLSASVVGRVGELLAEARLLELGHSVSRPSVDDGYDLVVDARLTIQVKTSKLAFPAGRSKPHLRFHVFSNPKQRRAADFFLFCGRNGRTETWWVVPGQYLLDSAAKGAISLYPGAKGRSEDFEQFREAWHLLLSVVTT